MGLNGDSRRSRACSPSTPAKINRSPRAKAPLACRLTNFDLLRGGRACILFRRYQSAGAQCGAFVDKILKGRRPSEVSGSPQARTFDQWPVSMSTRPQYCHGMGDLISELDHYFSKPDWQRARSKCQGSRKLIPRPARTLATVPVPVGSLPTVRDPSAVPSALLRLPRSQAPARATPCRHR